jgi:hypothetical protein
VPYFLLGTLPEVTFPDWHSSCIDLTEPPLIMFPLDVRLCGHPALGAIHSSFSRLVILKLANSAVFFPSADRVSIASRDAEKTTRDSWA